MTRTKNFSKPNGHAGLDGRPNGRAPVSPSHEARRADLASGGAASDDARETPNATAAYTAAAGMKRDACAEVASPAEGEKKKHGKNGSPEHTANRNAEKPPVDIPPGVEPLPADGAGFVDAMHAHVDLYQACARLVKSGDEKVAQRMVERLLEMSYGKSPSAAGEDAPEFVLDIDSAVARRAAEGAKQ